MWLRQLFEDVKGDGSRSPSFDGLAQKLDPEWITEALAHSGHVTLRRRKMPLEAAVWLMIGMALMRDRSIAAVAKHLGLGEGSSSWRPSEPTGAAITSGGLSRARSRLPHEAMERLYRTSAGRWTEQVDEQNRWRGLSLFAVDGSTLRLPDTEANAEIFGYPGSSRGGGSAYPQARIVGLLSVGSRVLSDLVVGSLDQGEQTLLAYLLDSLPDNSVTILDRGFVNYANFHRISSLPGARHWLCRAKSNTATTTVQTLGPGDELVELSISSKSRKEDASLPKKVVARCIRYKAAGGAEYILLTSMLDSESFPAEAIQQLYQQRWEIETAYDEVKTDLLERYETIRSQTPGGVLQEIWGLAIAYNLIRVAMAEAAELANVPPTRISFRNAMFAVGTFLTIAWQIPPGSVPKMYQAMLNDIAHMVLPPRRARSNPREVKVKMSSYKRKRRQVRGSSLK